VNFVLDTNAVSETFDLLAVVGRALPRRPFFAFSFRPALNY
jgi:hypothetical protein